MANDETTPSLQMEEPIIYAVGDIHGYLSAFYDVIDRAHASHQRNYPDRPAWLVTMGDHIDRGPQSADLIDLLINGGGPLAWFEKKIHLRGNHEQMMLDALNDTDGDAFRYWSQNGAKETLASYEIEMPDRADADFDMADPLGEVRGDIPTEHVYWLNSLPLTFAHDPFLFVHAGIVPGVPLDEQADKDLMWIRKEFLASELDHGYRVVHGHTPEDDKPVFLPNRINVDTGIYTDEGMLTCAALDVAVGDELVFPFFQVTPGAPSWD